MSLTIDGSGLAPATQDNFLMVGTTMDTFLPDGAPQRYSGSVPSAPTPGLFLGGYAAQNNFYRDDSSGATGLDSILGFYFGEGTLDGMVDLNDLDGVYDLPESIFSDFVPGTYHGVVSSPRSNALQGLGEVTVRVVPEPSVACLAGIGAILACYRGRTNRERL